MSPGGKQKNVYNADNLDSIGSRLSAWLKYLIIQAKFNLTLKYGKKKEVLQSGALSSMLIMLYCLHC